LATVFAFLHDAVIRVYDATGNVIETHEHAGDFKNWLEVLTFAPAKAAPKFVLITQLQLFLAGKRKLKTKS
jgi:hypothetical protein